MIYFYVKENHEHSNRPFYVEGKKYLITDIIIVKDRTWVNMSFNHTDIEPSSSFLLTSGNHNYLWNWFYTPKEIRQFKLKQLNTMKA